MDEDQDGAAHKNGEGTAQGPRHRRRRAIGGVGNGHVGTAGHGQENEAVAPADGEFASRTRRPC
jgi:hypothetical protein